VNAKLEPFIIIETDQSRHHFIW